MITGERIMMAAAAFLAVVLQVLVAPHISIGYAVPNFAVALCIVAALLRYEYGNPVLPFVLGLVFDLVSGGPVGAMAFALTLTVAFEAWLYERVRNDTLFMTVAVLAASALVTEVLYGVVFMLCGFAGGVLEAFVYRSLPCALYDFVIAVVLYAVMSRFFSGETVTRTEIKQL